MRRYEKVSGAFFCLLAIIQLTRLVLGWPVQVASVSVPLWASAIALVITAALATWGFRTALATPDVKVHASTVG
ncbi:MAG TPA: hypothetical protein VGH98_08550 [Gemmatimonadaceae bacterium]